MNILETLTYSPTLSDADSGQTPTISLVTMIYSPPFLTYNTGGITFSPTLAAHVGTHTITVTVTDGMDSPIYTFTLTVSYPPPYFSPALAAQTLKIGETFNYPFP